MISVAATMLCWNPAPVCMRPNPYILLTWFIAATGVFAAPTPTPTAPKPSATATPGEGTTDSSLKDDKAKLSYSLGNDLAKSLDKLQVDVDEEALVRGLQDALEHKQSAMSDTDIQSTLQAFRQTLRQKQQAAIAAKQEEMKKEAATNKEAGQKFLADNAKKDGVKTLPDGLQYKVIKQGAGDTPKSGDTVETNYRGTLIDGKEFDSSAKNGGPVSFPVDAVIKGWTEALELMPVGSKWQLFVPAELAYGDSGAGNVIPPGATLVFDIELLSIKKAGQK
jgi:FKBP-type peptidyl-prolyl cis-trans isomerase FklB